MKLFLKKIAERVPFFIGRYMALVPFSFRLGKDYKRFRDALQESETVASESQDIVKTFSSVFEYAKKNHSFYIDLYTKHGVFDLEIKSLEDIDKIPIIDKSMIRGKLEFFHGAMKINTGGTSGAPLAFYIDKNAFSREWAHMHFIWGQKGYSYTDVKLTFRGKNLGSKAIIYNPVHNEFIVNTYLSWKKGALRIVIF